MIRMPEGLVSGQLEERLVPAARAFQLSVHLSDLLPEQAGDTRSDAPKHLIRVDGADRKGLVHRVTKHLAENQANITNLQTEVMPGDTPRYLMIIEIETPPYLDARKLETELVSIGRDIGVTVSMQPRSG
jgi:predicted amino acid-binding ACT domain protein